MTETDPITPTIRVDADPSIKFTRRSILLGAVGSALAAVAEQMPFNTRQTAAENTPNINVSNKPGMLSNLESRTFTDYESLGFVTTGAQKGIGVISPSNTEIYVTEINLTPEGIQAKAVHQIDYNPWSIAGSETNRHLKILGGPRDHMTLFKADGSRQDITSGFTVRAIQIEPGDNYAIIYLTSYAMISRAGAAKKLNLITGALTDHQIDNFNDRIIFRATKIYTSESGQQYGYVIVNGKVAKLTHEGSKSTLQDLANPDGIHFTEFKSFSLGGKTVIWASGTDASGICSAVYQFIDGTPCLRIDPDKSRHPGATSVDISGYAADPITNQAYLSVRVTYPDGSQKSVIEEIEKNNPQDFGNRKLVASDNFPNGLVTIVNVLRDGHNQRLIIGIDPSQNSFVSMGSTTRGIYQNVGNLWQPIPIIYEVANPKTLHVPHIIAGR